MAATFDDFASASVIVSVPKAVWSRTVRPATLIEPIWQSMRSSGLASRSSSAAEKATTLKVEPGS